MCGSALATWNLGFQASGSRQLAVAGSGNLRSIDEGTLGLDTVSGLFSLNVFSRDGAGMYDFTLSPARFNLIGCS